MTTLSASSVEPDLMTVQCDVCFPQHIATTTLAGLTARGWRLRALGDSIDMCHNCRFEPHQGQRPRVERAAEIAKPTGYLPNFFIIGAAKAGTTSLFHYLDQHPDVFMAEAKELHFFCDPDYREWLPMYTAQFPVEAKIRGEGSTLYTRSPAIPGVPARLAELVPEARFVYMVRDPIERALASWREERFHVTERRSAAEAFCNPEDPHNAYVAASCYATQLTEYREHFPAGQILVLDPFDPAETTVQLVERTVEFLGLDPHPIDTDTRYNEGGSKLEYGDLAHRLRFSAPARAVRRMPMPVRMALTAPARRTLKRPIAAPDLPDELMNRLRRVLGADAAQFREMTGKPFTHWSV